MLGIRREKRMGGFFYKPVKENSPIHKTAQKEAVVSTEKASTNMANQKPAEQYNIEVLNEQIGSLRNVYRQFTHDEYELEEHLKHFLIHQDAILKEFKALIFAYNQAIVSLHLFDNAFKTDYLTLIATILLKYQYRLKNGGIHILHDYQLELDESTFKKHLKEDPKLLLFLFKNKDGIFTRIIDVFQTIKVPTKNLPPNSPDGFEGTIIDRRG